MPKTIVFEADANPTQAKRAILAGWTSEKGVEVVFTKKSGEERIMIVKLNESLLQPKGEVEAPGTIARRATNKENSNLVVTEWLPDTDEYQVRTIPLKNVTKVTAR